MDDVLFNVGLAVSAVAVLLLIQHIVSRRSKAGDTGMLKDDSLQLRRKFQHLVSGLAISLIYGSGMVSRTLALQTIAASSLALFILHRLRLHYSKLNDYLIRHYGSLLRANEVKELPAAWWFVVGCGLTIYICGPNRHLATLCMLYVSVGDPAASLVGGLYASTPLYRFSNGKSLVGSLGMLFVCAIITMFYAPTSFVTLSNQDRCFWSIIYALVPTICELNPLHLPLNDNLLIPFGSGLIISYGLPLSVLAICSVAECHF